MEPIGKTTYFRRNEGAGRWEYLADDGKWKDAFWRDTVAWLSVRLDAMTRGKLHPVWDRTNEE